MNDIFPDSNIRRYIVLFDGHNMLFRYFNGMPRTIVSTSGAPLHGAYGFVASVLHHLRRFQPTHAIACFDSQGRPERGSIDESYKANRQWDYGASGDDNPFTQLKAIEAALAHLGIPTVSRDGIEADDLIATCVERLRAPNTTVVIASTDQDLYQLIGDDVIVYQKRGKTEIHWSPDEIDAKYGITPALLVEWKALVGDPSDNVRGVPGVGGKTATSLLQCHGSLAAIYDNLASLKPRMRTLLLENRDLVEANLRILRLCRTVELKQNELLPLGRIPRSTLSVREVLHDLGLLA